jgi:hypothetical protein
MSTATTERPKTVENIQVLQVGKYGVRVDEKSWFGVNEPLTPSHFIVGDSYKVSVTASKTGKKYINEIIGQEAQAEVEAPKVTPKAVTPGPVVTKTTKADAPVPLRAGFGQPLTAYDLAVQRQISRAGIYQAALQSPAAVQFATSVTEYLSLVRQIADEGMKYITE